MTKRRDVEYDEAKRQELYDGVGKELKVYDDRNFLEQYALYMSRVQMYEISLKQDLQQRFGVPEDKADRMNLASILRHFVKHDIRAHPILYTNLTDLARQRNCMAHEFLANMATVTNLAGIETIRLFERDLGKWAFELELAVQQYLMLKNADMLYQDYGVKPTCPYPKIPEEETEPKPNPHKEC